LPARSRYFRGSDASDVIGVSLPELLSPGWEWPSSSKSRSRAGAIDVVLPAGLGDLLPARPFFGDRFVAQNLTRGCDAGRTPESASLRIAAECAELWLVIAANKRKTTEEDSATTHFHPADAASRKTAKPTMRLKPTFRDILDSVLRPLEDRQLIHVQHSRCERYAAEGRPQLTKRWPIVWVAAPAAC
jgi:hypothetical protein